jgi:hypothetical protein
MTDRYRRSLAVMLTVFSACGRRTEPISEPAVPPPPPPQPPTMSLEIPTLSDTIGVVVSNPIVIQVRRGTTAAAAADIRVTVSTPAGAIPLASVGVASSGPFTQTVAAQTNTTGEARVFISLGAVAGQGTILVEAPSLALRDSARFVVSPGRLVKWTNLPRDTAVFIANTLTIRYELFDRGGNSILSETPQVISATGVSATPTTGVFAAEPTVQRGRIILRTSLRTDTVQVSVVPRDTIVFVWHVERVNRLVAVGLDGTIVRTYGQSLSSGLYSPALSPNGLRVVSNEGQGWGGPITAANLFISDTMPLPRRTLGGSATNPKLRYEGMFFRSGDWILFQSQTPDDSSSVWRIRTDGSGEVEQLISRDSRHFIFDAFPFPDNRSVAIAFEGAIWRLDVATRQIVLPAIATTFNRPTIAVSPAGDRIAWTDLAYDLFVVNADGTGRRRLASGVGIYRPVWTRDGRYLIVATAPDAYSSIVDVATGTLIPLPWNRLTGNEIQFQEAGGRP